MRFSVIIPLYNKAPYAEKSVRSVLAQTFTDYELIIVDDGSTDGSSDVVKAVLEGTLAVVTSQPNQGVSAARNNGIAMAKGDYICFLDADDWWSPAFLEEMDAFINGFPEAGIYGVNYYYVKNGRSQSRIDIPTGYIDYFAEYARIMQMPITSISVAIPRGVFEEVGYFRPELKLGEDFDLWLRIAFKHKVAFLNSRLAYYNQDVDVKGRGVGHLRAPESHFLWNLDRYSDEEAGNPEFKQLIDNIRVYSLKPYYLSSEYRQLAQLELDKVDWTRQPQAVCAEYRVPVWLLRFKEWVRRTGYALKKKLVR